MITKLAENLKKIRKDHNLSQEQLAEELKVSRQAISKWESGNTYPEMDKILQICNKFNLDINDLLNNDIREIKSEQQTKNNINKYIDDFLNFITKTFNMFINFSPKTKLKCLIEQAIIITLLLITFGIIGNVFGGIFGNMISFIPDKAYYVLYNIGESIFNFIFLIFGIIIWLHIFKTRYIDYYEIATDNIEIENQIQTEIENEIITELGTTNTKSEPIRKNEKIILRDPKHSEYKFINGLLKTIVGVIKIWALITIVSIAFILISLVIGVVLSFLITKTGVFFLGTLITLLAAIAITVIIELILLNFVFNRQNKKKIMIWTFLISLIIAGIGSGLMFIGSLDFEISDGKEIMITQSVEVEMHDNLVISNIIENDIEYIETNNQKIKIEYLLNKHSSSTYDLYDNAEYKQLYIYSENPEIFKMIKESINYLNDKKLLNQNSQLSDIKIYTTKENIEKIRANHQALEVKYNLASNYETKIQNLDIKVAEQEATINELTFELEAYRK